MKWSYSPRLAAQGYRIHCRRTQSCQTTQTPDASNNPPVGDGQVPCPSTVHQRQGRAVWPPGGMQPSWPQRRLQFQPSLLLVLDHQAPALHITHGGDVSLCRKISEAYNCCMMNCIGLHLGSIQAIGNFTGECQSRWHELKCAGTSATLPGPLAAVAEA